MAEFDPYQRCAQLEKENAGLRAALREKSAKMADRMHRIKFLEQLISEYAKTTRRPNRDEWASVTPRLRFAVMLRDQFSCVYCGASAEHGNELVIDHIIPRSAGGRTVLQNLRTACVSCNKGKGASLLELEAMANPPRHPLAEQTGVGSPAHGFGVSGATPHSGHPQTEN